MLAGFETLSYPIVHPNPPIKSHDNLDFVGGLESTWLFTFYVNEFISNAKKIGT